MDRDENLYFENFDKLSLGEIRKLFDNLKHIGMTEDEIEKYAIQYKKFFEHRKAEQEKLKSNNVILIGDHHGT